MSNNYFRTNLFIAAVFSVTVLAIGQDLNMNRFTIDSGGVMHSTSRDLELSGTIGQPDAGVVLTARDLELSGGFWFPVGPCDCDEDGNVSLYDFAAFAECMRGPQNNPPSASCLCFDLDGDGDVDSADAGGFQLAFGN